MRKSQMHLFLALTLVATPILGLMLPSSLARQETRTPVSNTTKNQPRNKNEPRNYVPSTPQLSNQPAVQELAGVIADAQNLPNRSDAFKVLSKSANLLWLSSPAKSRTMFQELWQLTEAGGDVDDLRTDILRYLAPRDPKLAATWLDQVSKISTDSGDVPYSQQVKGSNPTAQRLNNLASKLVEQEDSTQAAKVLERALNVGVTPATLSTLTRLRQRNPALADSLVSRTLEKLNTRPTVVSLPSLYLLVDYVFPASNVDPNAATVNAPSRFLERQYFSTAYNVLNKTLTESEEVLKKNGYTKPDLRFRTIYQGQLAEVVVLLAPRFDREVSPEFVALARQSFATVAPNAALMSRFTRLRLSSSVDTSGDTLTDIALSLAKGDIDRARQLVGGVNDETVKKAVGQTVVKVSFGLYLAKSELHEALAEARKFEDPTVQAIALAQLARAARAKGDSDFSKLVIANAVSLFSGTQPSGLQARALLMLAPEALSSSVPDALDLLNRAVVVINSLPEVVQETAEYNLDDPKSLKDAPELQRAFSTIAGKDYEGTLTVARQLQPALIGLLARLAVVETELKKPNKKSRRSATVLSHAVKSAALTPAFLENGMRLPAGDSSIDVTKSSNGSGGCSCGPCMSTSSMPATPGPWWDCTSECLRSAGVSPISITLCAATCVTGNVPLCAICFAAHATVFNFCALYCAVYATPTYGTCLGWTDFVTYPTSGCVTGLYYQGPCTRSDAFRSRCEDYDDALCACLGGGYMSPIVIDVDNSGFSMTDAAGGVVFDMLKDGVPLGLSWTTAGSTNALLVLDRNANGTIDNGEELFGDITPQPASSTPNGFVALAEFDRPANFGNGNRKLDSQDAIFSQLRLWQDTNHNGYSESSELRPLAGLISAIDLDFKESRRTDQHGNQFRYRAKVYDVKGDHGGRWAWDVFLNVQ